MRIRSSLRLFFRLVILALVAGAPVSPSLAQGAAPELVSPVGGKGEGRVGSVCPAFGWTFVDGASGYELMVYEVSESGAGQRSPAAEPVVAKTLPRGASSWTPTLDECLPRAGRYGWAVGAFDDEGQVRWSRPGLFRVVEDGVDRPHQRGPSAAVRSPRVGQAPDGSTGNQRQAHSAQASAAGPVGGLAAPVFDPPGCSPSPFPDVPDSDPFCKWIKQLAADKISGGCGDGTNFCPDQPVTRRQMAALLGRAMHGTDTWQPCTLTTTPAGSTLNCPGGVSLTLVPRTRRVAAAYLHTCGIRTDGSLACWGNNSYGQISPLPAGSFTQISATGQHTCGVRTDNSVVCWGSGPVSPPPGAFTQVSTYSNHTCGVLTDGNVLCWGANYFGEGSPPADTGFSQVATGYIHTCGIQTDTMQVQCWGENSVGQTSPVPSDEFLQIAAGETHTCGIKIDRTLACWGDNQWNQTSPLPAGAFTQISATYLNTCGVRADGSVVCWGSYLPPAPPVGAFAQIAAGYGRACGVRTDGSVVCWGNDPSGASSPPAELQ